MTLARVVMFLNVKQLAIALFTTTLPTISIPRLPSPRASALINLASMSLSDVVYCTILI